MSIITLIFNADKRKRNWPATVIILKSISVSNLVIKQKEKDN